MTKREPHAAKRPKPQPGVWARVIVGCLLVGCALLVTAMALNGYGYKRPSRWFGATAVALFGQFFFWATIYSANTQGVVYSKKRDSWFSGRFTRVIVARRDTQPIRYWALTSVFLLFGLGLTAAGVYYFVSQWSTK